MFVINTQAYALTFALNSATKRLTSRARPWVGTCDADPTRQSCGSGGRYSSFYSGHAAVTATGAGLICAHHTQLSLYRGDVLDTGSCVLAVLGTAVTGALRIASDNHWASDVLVGHLMAYTSGYLLPTLLYYQEFSLAPRDEPAAPILAVLPPLTETSAQAHCDRYFLSMRLQVVVIEAGEPEIVRVFDGLTRAAPDPSCCVAGPKAGSGRSRCSLADTERASV